MVKGVETGLLSYQYYLFYLFLLDAAVVDKLIKISNPGLNDTKVKRCYCLTNNIFFYLINLISNSLFYN